MEKALKFFKLIQRFILYGKKGVNLPYSCHLTGKFKHHYTIKIDYHKAVRNWLKENIGENNYWILCNGCIWPEELLFKTEEDLIAFKIVWL